MTVLSYRIDMPYVSSEKLRTGLVNCQKKITDTFQPLGIEVDLLRDNFGSDPGLTDAPLHSAWEGISLVKSLLSGAL